MGKIHLQVNSLGRKKIHHEMLLAFSWQGWALKKLLGVGDLHQLTLINSQFVGLYTPLSVMLYWCCLELVV